MDATLNATDILANIRKCRNLQSKNCFRRSSLENYRAELVSLRQAGASYRDLSTWVKMTHRIKISQTTVMRYLKKLPELHSEKIPDRDPSSLDLFSE
jgi:hypothetical protein